MKIVECSLKDGLLYTRYDNGEECFQRLETTPPTYQEPEDFPIDKDLWESACVGCARCCSYRFITSEGIQESGFHCLYLDQATTRCTVYEDRWKLPGGCAPLHPRTIASWMPEDCPVRKLAKEHGF